MDRHHVPEGFRGAQVDKETPEGRLKVNPTQIPSLTLTLNLTSEVKLQELGVDEWPLPVANVTVAHTALIQDIQKLVQLEAQLAARR